MVRGEESAAFIPPIKHMAQREFALIVEATGNNTAVYKNSEMGPYCVTGALEPGLGIVIFAGPLEARVGMQVDSFKKQLRFVAREVLSGFSQGQRAPELLEQVHKLLS